MSELLPAVSVLMPYSHSNRLGLLRRTESLHGYLQKDDLVCAYAAIERQLLCLALLLENVRLQSTECLECLR